MFAAPAARTRWLLPRPVPALHRPQLLARRARERVRRSWLVAGGVVLAALAALAAYLFTPIFRPAPGPSVEAVSVARVVLEPADQGTAISLVLQDRAGNDAILLGELSLELREPDGAVWQVTRALRTTSFNPLPGTSLLAGRLGFREVIPPSAWTRPPRSGGQAAITVVATRPDGSQVRHQSTTRFP